MCKIAIIGMAGEFPGAKNITELWNTLLNGNNSVIEIPYDRWMDLSTKEKREIFFKQVYCRYGGFIKEPYHFDPVFFGIAPVIALKMDPQERRLLHLVYHALEDSAYFSDPISNVGVFVSAMFGHYTELNIENNICSTSFASIANRISYCFNFQGPSFCVDSMCSGSLTALHLAINSLKTKECKIAIVGSSNIMVHPAKYRLLSEGRFLSYKGRCSSFSAQADGYVPGEGTVGLVLKTYDDAVKDNDFIYSVIKGTAINCVGKSSGSYNVPSSSAQIAVIKSAISAAKVNYNNISYIEAHGTGTPVGDPIEFESLKQTYGTCNEGYYFLGSIKSNIGHLEAAAGLASIVKTTLQLMNKKIVPTLFYTPLNPKLNFENTNFMLVNSSQDWLSNTEYRMAGINSFGAGGSNAHIILREHIPIPLINDSSISHYIDFIFPISAKTLLALEQRVNALIKWIEKNPNSSLYEIGYTLACTREHHQFRICIIANNIYSLLKGLIKGSNNYVSKDAKLISLQERYLQGFSIKWKDFYLVKRLCKLPLYPLKGDIYWGMDIPIFKDKKDRNVKTNTHPLKIIDSSDYSLEEFTFSNKNGKITGMRSKAKDGKHLLLLSATNTHYQAWHQQIKTFHKNGFILHIPHYPGYIYSPMIKGEFKLSDVSSILEDYIAEYIKKPLYCIGWSLGGCFAQYIALSNKIKLKSLIFVGAFPKYKNNIISGIKFLKEEEKENQELIELIFRNKNNLLDAIGCSTNQDTIDKYYIAMSNFDMSNYLSKIDTPTLVVYGKNDKIIHKDQLELFKKIPNIKFIQLDAGHFIPLTHAGKFNELCLKFFKDD